jgi:hypothetical protein
MVFSIIVYLFCAYATFIILKDIRNCFISKKKSIVKKSEDYSKYLNNEEVLRFINNKRKYF